MLSLALLFAQLGMVVHASTHLKVDPHAAPTQSQLCGECLSFAPMQNMVGGAPTVILFAVTISRPRCSNPASRSVAFRTARSRPSALAHRLVPSD